MPPAPESQAEHAILDWAQSSGVHLTALKQERSITQGPFLVISYHVTATGSMPTMSRLLWSIETATVPVRLNDLQISPQPEGTDNLSIQLSISTLCVLPDAGKPAKTEMSAVRFSEERS